MVKRSRGYLSKFTRRLKKERKFTINDYVKSFKEGEKVYIDIQPEYKIGGMPHSRFNGKIGRVIEKRGDCYVVEVKMGGVIKRPIIHPIHLKPIPKTMG